MYGIHNAQEGLSNSEAGGKLCCGGMCLATWTILFSGPAERREFFEALRV